ncbi:MAG: hypothetical protein H7A23_15645 [Leptospiraceae bacterium]|nr:hypothetical protein [Leptospiraceae bacterium]MCP5495984.1 hypothetical protein [Leptospiraceae bacterium]
MRLSILLAFFFIISTLSCDTFQTESEDEQISVESRESESGSSSKRPIIKPPRPVVDGGEQNKPPRPVVVDPDENKKENNSDNGRNEAWCKHWKFVHKTAHSDRMREIAKEKLRKLNCR